MEATRTDAQITRALQAFVRNVAGDNVRVTYDAGRVLLDGAVASRTALRALVDLVRAHEGVVAVESRLRVAAAVSRTVG